MNKINFTQDHFDKLVNNLNHRTTKMEMDIRWLKRIMSWQIVLISAIFVSILGLLIKLMGG